MSIHDNLNSPLLKRVKANEEALNELQEGAGSPTKIATGTDVYIGDGAALPIIDFKLTGKSVQNGTPTPDAPIAIDNSGDCVEMIQGGFNASTGAWATNTACICNKKPIPCTSGDIVNIECDDAENIRVLFYNESGFVSTEVLVSSGATVPSGVTHFNFNVNNTNGISVDTVGKISLTINGKYVVQIPYANKNLWTFGDQTFTQNSPFNITLPAGTYTFSAIITSSGTDKTYSRVVFYDKNSTQLGIVDLNRNVRNGASVTVDSDIGIISFYAEGSYSQSANDTATFSSIQLERGEVMTDYEEHTESIATILLDAPLRESDVMSSKEGVRNRASVVFDGSETWYIGNGYFYIKVENGVQSRNVLSTHYKNDGSSSITNDGNIWINNASQLIVVDSRFTSVGDFKDWLASNPITVEYELAEPIVETLDSASQAALNAIETFNPITHITVDSRIKPEISVEYVHKAYESIVNSLNNRIVSDEWKHAGEVNGRTHLTLPEGWKELNVVAYSFPYCAPIHVSRPAIERSESTLMYTLPLSPSGGREVQIRINKTEVYLWQMFNEGAGLADDAALLTNLVIAAYYK